MGLFSRTEQTDAASLAERLATRSVLVVDVRQPSEWRHGHIRGSKNEPLMQLKRRLDTLPRDKTIVTVCASGHRSAAAARTLRRAGYTVENLKGGMHAWARAGLAVDRGDQDGAVVPRSRLSGGPPMRIDTGAPTLGA